jgi:hypothetical protein
MANSDGAHGSDEPVKPVSKRGAKHKIPATVRNASALLVNPLSSQHIVGVEEVTLPDGAPVISGRISFDGGASWKESWPLAMKAEWAGVVGPALATDARGALNLAALALHPDHAGASLVVYRSEDGGIHWEFPQVVLQGVAPECYYSIASDLSPASPFRGNVYVTADMGNSLCFARSNDGHSWSGVGHSKPGPLLPGQCFNPEVLVDAGGAVHVLWVSGPSGSILTVDSADGGDTFCAPVTVAEGIAGADERLSETAPATCIAPDGVALCVWTDHRESRARIYYRRSMDGGRSWQGPLAGEPLVRNAHTGQHEFQPHLLITAGGEICCAFYEYGPKTPGGEPLVDLAMAISYDRGASFTGHMVLSERPWDPAVDQPLSRGATRGALGIVVTLTGVGTPIPATVTVPAGAATAGARNSPALFLCSPKVRHPGKSGPGHH